MQKELGSYTHTIFCLSILFLKLVRDGHVAEVNATFTHPVSKPASATSAAHGASQTAAGPTLGERGGGREGGAVMNT